MTIELCLSPALYPFYKKENDTVVVVDIFRASTTLCMAFSNGAASVIPVADIEQARQYKKKGFLVAAERNTRKVDFADFGNSPFEYSKEKVLGRDIVFTTTNGTRAIEAAKESEQLFIGAFSNIDSLAEACLKAGERVVVLCAGWNNRVNVEDTLFGGAFAKKMIERGDITIGSDTVRMAMALWEEATANPVSFVKSSDHYRRLVANGVESDASFCFIENSTTVLPFYDKAEKRLVCP